MAVNQKAFALPWVCAWPSGGPKSANTYRQMSYSLDESGMYTTFLNQSPEFGAKYAGKMVVPFLRCPGGGWPNRPTDLAQLSEAFWSDTWRSEFVHSLATAKYPYIGIHLGAVRGMLHPEEWFYAAMEAIELLDGLQDKLIIGLDECSAIEVDRYTHPQVCVARMFLSADFTCIVEQGIMRHQAAWFPRVSGFVTTRSQLELRDSGKTNDFVGFDGYGSPVVVLDDVPGSLQAKAKWRADMLARGFTPAVEGTTSTPADAGVV